MVSGCVLIVAPLCQSHARSRHAASEGRFLSSAWGACVPIVKAGSTKAFCSHWREAGRSGVRIAGTKLILHFVFPSRGVWRDIPINASRFHACCLCFRVSLIAAWPSARSLMDGPRGRIPIEALEGASRFPPLAGLRFLARSGGVQELFPWFYCRSGLLTLLCTDSRE